MPPAPEVAEELGRAEAFPEFPDPPALPEPSSSWLLMPASDLVLLLPDDAVPVAVGLLVAVPEDPVDPDVPDVAVPLLLLWPELPEELPLPALPVSPLVAVGEAVALPVPPDAPVPPVLAVPSAVGFAVAFPELPPRAEEVLLKEPVLPLVASAVTAESAAPEVPPVAVPVAAPEFPERATAFTLPDPPLPLELPEPEGFAVAEPVEPEVGLAVAFPPLPDCAEDEGLAVAFPESPLPRLVA